MHHGFDVITIDDDNGTERTGCYRAFWRSNPADIIGVSVVGCASAYGPFRTIKACAADARRRYPDAEIYRNNRRIA